MADKKSDGYWFSLENGTHIHVGEGETPKEATNKFLKNKKKKETSWYKNAPILKDEDGYMIEGYKDKYKTLQEAQKGVDQHIAKGVKFKRDIYSEWDDFKKENNLDFDNDFEEEFDDDASPNETKLNNMELDEETLRDMASRYIGEDRLKRLAEINDIEDADDVPAEEIIRSMSDDEIADMIRLNGLDDYEEDNLNQAADDIMSTIAHKSGRVDRESFIREAKKALMLEYDLESGEANDLAIESFERLYENDDDFDNDYDFDKWDKKS